MNLDVSATVSCLDMGCPDPYRDHLSRTAHAFAAWRLGDDTAFRLGRVTFNPLKHFDPFGTILLQHPVSIEGSVLVWLGEARACGLPAPRNPRRDMAIVAMAGPFTNVILAFISALLLHLVWLFPEAAMPWLVHTLSQSILLNLVLAIFNMIPVPPLDGSRLLRSLLPTAFARPYAQLERWAF